MTTGALAVDVNNQKHPSNAPSSTIS